MDRVGFITSGYNGWSQRSVRAVSARRSAMKMTTEQSKVSRRDMIAGAAAMAIATFAEEASAAEGVPASVAAFVESYNNTQKGFKMSRPSGWNEFSASESFDVKWVDIIDPLEQITVVTTPVSKGKSVTDIGTPEQVGEKLSKSRKMDVVKVSSKDSNGVQIYTIELTGSNIHQLTVLTVNKSKLYTVNVTCPEVRTDCFRSVALLPLAEDENLLGDTSVYIERDSELISTRMKIFSFRPGGFVSSVYTPMKTEPLAQTGEDA